ncbi:enoyl-CoA hydratase-related protein [Heyndrickxia coagulans]|uniref:enoyl-CoA hydratase-related protein n=1 Tax=Heyndrickxia coagulans TaxID=1398 RepID=UPI003D2146A4
MQTVDFTVKNHVGWLTLNRPDKLNAFNETMNREIIDVLTSAEQDPHIRALVLTGAGRAFCSGEDLGSLSEQADHGEIIRKRYIPMVKKIAAFEKPLIAAVNGPAAGAGFSLCLACDFRIASEQATFVNAFIHIGLVPDSGNLYLLPRIAGYAKALELSCLGEKISAPEAMDYGLLTKVVPACHLEQETQHFAERLAAMPTKAIGLVKRYMQKSFESTLDEMLENEAYAQRIAGQTADHKEGVRAFFEKRKPEYKGN